MTSLLASDVYSFGVIIFECLSRKEPFEGRDPLEIAKGVLSGELSLQTPTGCGLEMSTLLAECLKWEPAHRPPFAEIQRRLESLDPSQVTSGAFSSHDDDGPIASMPRSILRRRSCTAEGHGNNPCKTLASSSSQVLLTSFFTYSDGKGNKWGLMLNTAMACSIYSS